MFTGKKGGDSYRKRGVRDYLTNIRGEEMREERKGGVWVRREEKGLWVRREGKGGEKRVGLVALRGRREMRDVVYIDISVFSAVFLSLGTLLGAEERGRERIGWV